MSSAQTDRLPHIVVLGAGFAGLTFCQKFPEGLARITVVDKQNHHLFHPLLYQVATAGLAAVDIAQPVRSILRAKPNLAVLMAEVTAIDLQQKCVRHAHGELHYDYLVIGLGSQTSYFGHPEWEEFAPGLKTLDDALRIRRRILSAYEQAEAETDAERRLELMTTVVVGGGPTGVELAGTFAELSRKVLRRDFDHIDPTRARVILIEGGPRVLGAFPPDLSASAQRQLERLGVDVRTNLRVTAIRANEVELPAEKIRAGNIIWAAGVSAVPITQTLGVPLDRAGRLKVEPDLSLPGFPRVFATGDLISLVDPNGTTVPGVAQGGMQTGAHVAQIIAGEIGGRAGPVSRRPFVYNDKGNMATIGRSAAVAQIGRLHFSGYPAWFAWLGLHLVFLLGFRNRLSVLMQWIYSYLTYRRGARIITGTSGEKSAGSA